MDDDKTFMDLLDPLGIGKTTAAVWQAMLSDPEHLVRSQQRLATAWVDLLQNVSQRAFGDDVKPLAKPEKGDKRFEDPRWNEIPALDALKQAYLIATDAVLNSISETSGLEPTTVKRARFFAKRFADAMSPTNFAFFNPLVIEETLRTGGENLAKGMRNLLADMEENGGRPALVDKSAFTVGGNVGISPGNVVYRNALCELIQYAPSTEKVYAKPVVIIPPWINKFYILDLQPNNSFVRGLVDNGYTTFMISWRNPDASMRETTMRDYLMQAIACARIAAEICGTADVNLTAYCIGGTLAAMALAYLAKKGERVFDGATFLASLIDFKDAGEIDAFLSEDALAYIEKKMGERGYLEGAEMSDTFNMLRDNDLIWSVAVNRYLLGKDAPAFDLLYWNSDSTRMPEAMHRYYLRNMYVENNLVKPDVLEVDGVGIDLHRIENDTYVVATLEDHIAPWRSVYRAGELFGGDVQFRLGHSGHIAGIVNPPEKKKGSWLSAPFDPQGPEAWLKSAQKHEGSWWPDWYAWLAKRSGAWVDARTPGTEKYPAQEAAPGTYVLAK